MTCCECAYEMPCYRPHCDHDDGGCVCGPCWERMESEIEEERREKADEDAYWAHINQTIDAARGK